MTGIAVLLGTFLILFLVAALAFFNLNSRV
jgi:hypothetical protein